MTNESIDAAILNNATDTLASRPRLIADWAG